MQACSLCKLRGPEARSFFFLSRYSNNNDGVLGVVCCDVVLCELLQKSFKIFILHAKLKSCNLGLTSRAKSSRVKSSRLPRRHLRAKYNHFPLNQIELNHNNNNNNNNGGDKKKQKKSKTKSSLFNKIHTSNDLGKCFGQNLANKLLRDGAKIKSKALEISNLTTKSIKVQLLRNFSTIIL